eukprot:CAMPEP_0179421818 /NCGR_PEP_ID=MMETSP0799-20121207/10036_1 /TAXON_ID=46947 /ORGANISM="Geminigera cryophila, Strain CCMP2564" /LENGTH=47 /DNA_ID= /DNA_START= /DNA_END= /DNA_ORIENTATION=
MSLQMALHMPHNSLPQPHFIIIEYNRHTRVMIEYNSHTRAARHGHDH